MMMEHKEIQEVDHDGERETGIEVSGTTRREKDHSVHQGQIEVDSEVEKGSLNEEVEVIKRQLKLCYFCKFVSFYWNVNSLLYIV